MTHPKIAVLHNSFDAMGGAERVTATLIEALNDVGICPAVHTIAPIPEDYLCSFYCKKLHYKLAATFPLKINTLNIYQKVLTNLLSFKLAKYDVVINMSMPTPFDGIFKRHILYIHNPIFLMKTKKYANKPFSSSKYEKSLFWKLYYTPYNLILQHAIRNVKAELLANSYFTKWRLKKYAGLQSKVVYPPVDIDAFSPVFGNTDRNGVISIGRFSPEKRQLKQLEIAKCLPETTFRICGSVVMPYNWQWFQYIKSKVEEMELKNVELHPNPPFKKLVKLIGESKIFIHTMLYEDFGLTTCEAIAGGCIPCVINSGGQKELYHSKIFDFTH
ncbi:MAG: glycosyltransferase [Fervidobacterium sp.]